MRSRVAPLFPIVILTLVALSPRPSPAQPGADRLGEVSLPVSCAEAVRPDFDRAVALLHSFEFQESRGVFESLAARDPRCAMAQWGIAMTYYHPLWAPPSKRDLELGQAAAERAGGLGGTERERDYIAAIASFYRNSDRLDHRTRARAYERAMKGVHERHPDDREAEIFYALAILSNADPTDKSYAVQQTTGPMLEALVPEMPNHPGLAHYIIHSYDYPPLAERAVDAARRYLEIAPSLPHALHMSSHIFTQTGMWEASIDANTRSAEAARERGRRFGTVAQAQLQEMHSLDYLAYAYLQRGQDDAARAVLDHIGAFAGLDWTIGVVSFNAGAVPVRYTLERRRWTDAASLPLLSGSAAVAGGYENRGAVALRYWARSVGAARGGDVQQAERDLEDLERIAAELRNHPVVWARNTSEVLRLEAAAWLSLARGEAERALDLMRSAAALEDQTDKSSLSPGRVLPAHEQLGDMLLEVGLPEEALTEYEISLTHAARRFNSLHGAARAARESGDFDAARRYYDALLELAAPDSPRPEIAEAREFLDRPARG